MFDFSVGLAVAGRFPVGLQLGMEKPANLITSWPVLHCPF
jgi:hypothetical protein